MITNMKRFVPEVILGLCIVIGSYAVAVNSSEVPALAGKCFIRAKILIYICYLRTICSYL